MLDTTKILHNTSDIAVETGKIIRDFYYGEITISTKSSHHDLVTNADQAAESHIIQRLKELYPEHNILCEESAIDLTINPEVPTWIVDPLDGTTNFSHKIPHFSVSIGLYLQNQGLVAVVYDPMRNELYTASDQEITKLNGKPISVSQTKDLDKAVLATGFPYDRNSPEWTTTQDRLTKLHKITRGIRRFGSAALDLAYVAAGRYDGFFEYSLKPWDIAAGKLLVLQAGGSIKETTNPIFIQADNNKLNWAQN